MEYFTKLNAKLDLGWKITDASCEQCKKTLVYNPTKNEFFCVMCEKIAELTIEPQKSSSKVVEKIKSIGSSENSAEKPREEDFSLYPKYIKKEKNDLSSKIT